MQVELETLGSLKRKISVTVPKEKAKRFYEKEFLEAQKNFSMNGFRQGKVPRQIILKRYGKAITGAAVENIVQATQREALKEEKATIAHFYHDENPVDDFKPDQDFTYRIVYDIIADSIDKAVYRDYQFEKELIEVTERDIETDKIKTFRELCEKIPKEGPVEEGDFIEFLLLGENEEEEQTENEPGQSAEEKEPVNEAGDADSETEPGETSPVSDEKETEEESDDDDYDERVTRDFRVGVDHIFMYKGKGEGFIGKMPGESLMLDDFEEDGNKDNLVQKAVIRSVYRYEITNPSLEKIQGKFPNVKNEGELDGEIRKGLEKHKRVKRLDSLRMKLEKKLLEDLDFEVSQGLLDKELEAFRKRASNAESEDRAEDSEENSEEDFKNKTLKDIRLRHFVTALLTESEPEGFQERLDNKLQNLRNLAKYYFQANDSDNAFIRQLESITVKSHYYDEAFNLILVELMGKDINPDLDEKEDKAEALPPGENENPQTEPVET